MSVLQHAIAMADAAEDAWQDMASRRDRHDVVGMGADGSPTTRADRELDAAILAVAKDIGLDVLSEEAGFVSNGGARVAVVDPLDGSRNAGRGIPFHCVSIAIGTHDLSDLESAIVLDLARGTRYTAAAGEGAFVDGDPVRRRSLDVDDVIVGLIADYSDMGTVQQLQSRHHHIRDLGSAALELALTATGAMDAFHVPQAWLRVIDIAAGTLLVREAGGVVLDTKGNDLDTPFDLSVRTGLLALHAADRMEVMA